MIAYGLIKRGRSPIQAVSGNSIIYDWPPYPGMTARGVRKYGELLEDHVVPDAFGIQLLGDGYQGRIPPNLAGWSVTAVGDALLLEDAHLERWFSEDRPVEATLTSARESLRSITATEQEMNDARRR